MGELRQPTRRRFESESEAEEWCDQLRVARITGTPVERVHLPLLALCEAYLDEMEQLPSERTGKPRSQKTLDGYRFDLALFASLPRRTRNPSAEPLVGWADDQGIDHVEQCSADVMHRYTKWLRGKYSALVARKAAITLKALMDWACEDGYIDGAPKIPIPRVPARQHRRALSDGERQAILTKGDPRYRDTWLFFMATGLRLGEYARLHVDDFETAIIDGEPCWQVRVLGKGGKKRTVQLAGLDEVVVRLMDAANSRWNCPGRISPVGYSRLSRVWCEDERPRMGLPEDVTPHVLRHDFATGLRDDRVDIKTISSLMGHSSVRITADLYIHDSKPLRAEAIATRAESLRATAGDSALPSKKAVV